MVNCSIPEQFRCQVIQNVRLLMIAASESSHVVQAFVFNDESGASLSTLIIVANKIDSPSDPNSSVATRSLVNAISVITNSTKDIISISKSSNSTTLTRIIRTGFTYFQHKSRVLKVINIPAERATKFTNAIIMDYNISLQGSFMLGLTYMDDFVWDYIEYLYSPAMNGNHRSLTLFKNGDNQTNTASFFIADINADW
ncbi:unnamed protein product [Rotaria sp. Silwood2]|nr:unnamed protein product [Rotaria sp. Silwood2]CAF3994005.1 unnamed protein product [Rotaria sp. Silwood2]